MRTSDENQDRAHITASRRPDRSIEARMEPALKASAIHKKRTGRGLQNSMQDVINEGMYIDGEGDMSRHVPSPSPRLRAASVGNNAGKSMYSSSLPVRKELNVRNKPEAQLSIFHTSKSSGDSSGRFTPDSIHESTTREDSPNLLPTTEAVDQHLHQDSSSRSGDDGTNTKRENIRKQSFHRKNCDCFDHTKIMTADGNGGDPMLEKFTKTSSYNERLCGKSHESSSFNHLTSRQLTGSSVMLGDTSTMLQDLCINDLPSVINGRRLMQHIEWLMRDLAKDLEEDTMEKLGDDEGNVARGVVDTEPEKVEETDLEKQDRLMNEIRTMRLEETRDRLKQLLERAKAKSSQLAATEMKQGKQGKEKVQTDLRTDQSKLCNNALEVMKDVFEKQIHLLEVGDQKQEIYFRLSGNEGCVELERVAVEGMRKSFVEMPEAETMKVEDERQQQFDYEITRLEKEKVVRRLNTEVAQAKREEVKALKQAKQLENELFWTGLNFFWSIALTVGAIILVSPPLFLLLLLVFEEVCDVWGRLRA